MKPQTLLAGTVNSIISIALATALGGASPGGSDADDPLSVRVAICANGALRFQVMMLGDGPRKGPPRHPAACHVFCLADRKGLAAGARR